MKKIIIVVGLLILVVAVISWTYFNYVPPSNPGAFANQMLFKGFSRAVDTPNELVVSENLKLIKDASYSANSFALSADLEEKCVEIQASDSDAFSVYEAKAVQINDLIQANVYYKCIVGAAAGKNECPLFCTVSFGKELS